MAHTRGIQITSHEEDIHDVMDGNEIAERLSRWCDCCGDYHDAEEKERTRRELEWFSQHGCKVDFGERSFEITDPEKFSRFLLAGVRIQQPETYVDVCRYMYEIHSETVCHIPTIMFGGGYGSLLEAIGPNLYSRNVPTESRCMKYYIVKTFDCHF